MGKFLLGIITGAILIVLVGVVGFFAIASLKSKPPTVADGSTLVIHLSGDIPERPPVEIPLPFLGDRPSVTVLNVWSMLRRAAEKLQLGYDSGALKAAFGAIQTAKHQGATARAFSDESRGRLGEETASLYEAYRPLPAGSASSAITICRWF